MARASYANLDQLPTSDADLFAFRTKSFEKGAVPTPRHVERTELEVLVRGMASSIRHSPGIKDHVCAELVLKRRGDWQRTTQSNEKWIAVVEISERLPCSLNNWMIPLDSERLCSTSGRPIDVDRRAGRGVLVNMRFDQVEDLPGS